MSQNKVWVVEMLSEKLKWEPCAAAFLTKKDAHREMMYYWKHNDPSIPDFYTDEDGPQDGDFD